MDERICVVCGRALDVDARRDALVCSPPCRAERGRLRAILDGRGSGPYRSVVSRLGALENRARGATGGRLRRGREQ
jgi:hypothetical protein